MKMLLAAALAVAFPALAHPDLALGGSVLYAFDPWRTTPILGVSSLSPGFDSTLTVGILRMDFSAVFRPTTSIDGYASYPAELCMMLDGGLNFDIRMLRFGAGAGPSFCLNVDASAGGVPDTAGFNAKGEVSLLFPRWMIGVTAYYIVPDLFLPTPKGVFTVASWWLGISAKARLSPSRP